MQNDALKSLKMSQNLIIFDDFDGFDHFEIQSRQPWRCTKMAFFRKMLKMAIFLHLYGPENVKNRKNHTRPCFFDDFGSISQIRDLGFASF